MKIIEKTINILSQKEYRGAFLLMSLILLVAILFPLRNISLEEINHYKITDVKDSIELILILLTLFILWISTNKSEISRYKNNWKFYQDSYPKLQLMYYERENNQKITSSSIDYSKYIHNYKENMRIDDIEFILNDCEYSLPFLIEEQARDILIQKFNIQSYTDYNGLTLSLKKITCNTISNSNPKLTFSFCKAYYFQALLTNLIPEHEIIHKVTVRDIIEPPSTKTISLLEDSLAANHLGISILISVLVDNEKYLIIPKRSNDTAVFKGNLSPSISGAGNIHSCRSIDGSISIKTFFENEFQEEILILIRQLFSSSEKDFLSSLLKNAILVGITRELKRLGKPEMFFIYNSNLTISKQFIKDQAKEDIINIPSFNIEKKERNIDTNENSSFLLVKVNSIDKIIHEKFHNSKNKSSYLNEESNAYLNQYKISESLLVNLIFLKNHSKLWEK